MWSIIAPPFIRRLLAYDTTNFYTYVASTNTRNELAQRGHNKQGRHNLRQVGLSRQTLRRLNQALQGNFA